MIFLQLEKIDDAKAKITLTHYQPETLPQTMLTTGIEVETIPDPVSQDGKRPILYYKYEDKSLYYEYEDIPKTSEQRISDLEAALATQQEMNAQLLLKMAGGTV